MAATTCVTRLGARSSAFPFSTATRSASTILAVAVAASAPAWAGSAAGRKQVFWLPAANVPFLDNAGRVSPAWYRAFVEAFENRLGGVSAPGIGEVITTTANVQAQIVGVQTLATGALTVANASADAVNTVAAVSQSAGLPGADEITPVDRYEARYG